MPAHYAHYRFVKALLPVLPPEVRKAAARFPRLFEMGFQGPDPFFYYNILMKTQIGALGKGYHRYTGSEFFSAAGRRYREDPSEGALAYLFGVLAHYCLDAACHPYINRYAADHAVSHTTVETDFDRHLLTLDGEAHPETFDGSRYLRLSRGEAATAAVFYPPATQGDFLQASRNMAALIHWMCSPPGPRQLALKAGLAIMRGKFSAYVRKAEPDPNCAEACEMLTALCAQAAGRYPAMAESLYGHLTAGTQLSGDFTPTFE